MHGHDDYIGDGLDFDNDEGIHPLDGRAKPAALRVEATSELDAKSTRLEVDAAPVSYTHLTLPTTVPV